MRPKLNLNFDLIFFSKNWPLTSIYSTVIHDPAAPGSILAFQAFSEEKLTLLRFINSTAGLRKQRQLRTRNVHQTFQVQASGMLEIQKKLPICFEKMETERKKNEKRFFFPSDGWFHKV